MSHICIQTTLKQKYGAYFAQFLKGVPLSELEKDFEISFREFYCIFSNLFLCSDVYGLIFQAYENQILDSNDPPLQSMEELSRLAENLSRIPFRIIYPDSNQLIDIFIELRKLGAEIKNLSIRNHRLEYLTLP